jgi:lipoprotein NlpI
MKSVRLFLAPVLCATALASPGGGQADILDECLDTWEPETIFQVCTAVIESGRWSGRELADAYFRRGLGHYGIHDYAPALTDFTRAFQLAPENAEILYFRGIVHRLARQHAASIADLTELISRKPDHIGAYNNRALAYAEIGNHDRALSDYDRALRLNPKLQSALVGRGHVHLAMGNPELALADFEAALRWMAVIEGQRRALGEPEEKLQRERAEAEEGRDKALRSLGRPVTQMGPPAPYFHQLPWLGVGTGYVAGTPSELAECALTRGGLAAGLEEVGPDDNYAIIRSEDGWVVVLLLVELGQTLFVAQYSDGSTGAKLTRRVGKALRACIR